MPVVVYQVEITSSVGNFRGARVTSVLQRIDRVEDVAGEDRSLERVDGVCKELGL